MPLACLYCDRKVLPEPRQVNFAFGSVGPEIRRSDHILRLKAIEYLTNELRETFAGPLGRFSWQGTNYRSLSASQKDHWHTMVRTAVLRVEAEPACHRMAASITALRVAGSLVSPEFRGFGYARSEGEDLILMWSRDRR